MWSSKNDNSLLQSNVLKFLFLEIVCLVLMVLDYSSKIATPVRAGLSTITYPLVKAIEWPQQAYSFLQTAVSDQTQLIEENTELRGRLSQAQVDLIQLEVIQQQNKELRQLLQAKKQLPLVTTSAFVSDINTGLDEHLIVIDQGSHQGVHVGQTVLDLNGVAGQVTRVGLESAHVLLISDKNHAIPLEILRSGYRTIAYGTGDMSTLHLPEMQQSSDIQTGDVVITSGYGDLFPRGLKIGVVEETSLSPDRSFLTATAVLSADLSQMKQVLLVWSKDETIEATD